MRIYIIQGINLAMVQDQVQEYLRQSSYFPHLLLIEIPNITIQSPVPNSKSRKTKCQEALETTLLLYPPM